MKNTIPCSELSVNKSKHCPTDRRKIPNINLSIGMSLDNLPNLNSNDDVSNEIKLNDHNEEHNTKKELKINGNNYSSPGQGFLKDVMSVRDDFTFKNYKKSFNDTKSENLKKSLNFNDTKSEKIKKFCYQSNQTSKNDITDYLDVRDEFKKSVATVMSTNKIREFSDIEKNENILNCSIKSSNVINPFQVDKSIKLPQPLISEEEDQIVEDEFAANENDDERISISDNQSVISSNVLSHIHTPKMISNIKTSADQSFSLSTYSRSELNSRYDRDIANNILNTDSINNTFLPNVEDTEFEIINENSHKFTKFIETPKSSDLFFSNSLKIPTNQAYTNQNNSSHNNSNPKIKELNDKLKKKEKETKILNEKIQKIVYDLHKIEQENTRYERRIEKEEAETETLRHMLNFLMTNA